MGKKLTYAVLLMFFKSCKPFRVTANFYIKVYLRYSDIINIRQLTVSGYDVREKIFQFLYWDSNFSYPGYGQSLY